MGLLNILIPGLSKTHTGSWGTPEFGASELYQKAFFPNKAVTAAGGSDLWNNSSIGGGVSGTGSVDYSKYQSVGGNQVAGSQTTGNYSASGINSQDSGNVNVTGGGGTEGGGVSLDDAFLQAMNDYYSPAYSRLDLLKQNYEQQLPVSQQQVENSYTEALQPIEQRLTTGTQQIQKQQTETQEGKENAISQARRLYNELMQKGITRFGAGSSAGPAYSEIVGQTTAQQIGGSENVAQKAFNDLSTDLRNLQDFTSQQKVTLADKKKTALDQLRVDFDTKMREIEGQKGVLDQAKAEQKIDELVRARERAYQIEDAATAFQRQIDLFEKGKAAELAQSYSVNQGISSQALTQFRNLINTGFSPLQASQLTGIDLSQVQGVVSPTNAWKQNEYGRWVNTVTGQIIGNSLDLNSYYGTQQ